MSKTSRIAAALEKGYTMEQLRSMEWDRFLEVTGYEPKEIRVKMQGRDYACLDVAYWDPERKSPTHKRKIIGYYDEDGRLVETGSEADTRPRTRQKPEVYAQTSEIGRDILFDGITRNIGLRDAVTKCFGDDAEAVLTCAYYFAGHSGALCHCEQWSAGSDTPIGKRLGDQRISELLKRITDERIGKFFGLWMKHLGDDDNYALDITSVSSYNQCIRIVRAGYNRDKEDLEQVNLALLIGSNTRLPAYYSILPGNIVDKSSLRLFIKTVKARGFVHFSVVTDKGFCTVENINLLYSLKQRFLMGMENRLNIAKDAIDGVRDSIVGFDNYYRVGGDSVYCTTDSRNWTTPDGKNHRFYVHVFYDPQRKEDDVRHFNEKLDKVRKGILEGDEAFASSPMASKYLRVTKGHGKVSVFARQEAIDERNMYSGYLVLVSNHVKDAHEALRVYRDKETAESAFDDLKNGMDLMRLRIHGEDAMEGKVFLAFLGLVLKLEMTNVMEANPDLCHRSREEVITEMSILRKATIGKSTLYDERTKLQKIVIKAFGIKAPFKDTLVLDEPGDKTEPS